MTCSFTSLRSISICKLGVPSKILLLFLKVIEKESVFLESLDVSENLCDQSIA